MTSAPIHYVPSADLSREWFAVFSRETSIRAKLYYTRIKVSSEKTVESGSLSGFAIAFVVHSLNHLLMTRLMASGQ